LLLLRKNNRNRELMLQNPFHVAAFLQDPGATKMTLLFTLLTVVSLSVAILATRDHLANR
jgi:hypothetical protein